MKRLLFFIVAVVWLVPLAARAEPSDADRATARALAREGFEAQQQGQYAIAADRFTRAEALVHAPTLLLGLARAQVGLSRLLEAQETYQRILREPMAPNAPAAFAKALEESKRELAALAPRLGWVTIQVGGATSPTVTLDDLAVPVAALGVRRACDPGAHWVKASAPGFAPAESTFVLVEGGEQTVTLAMDPLPEARAPSGRGEPGSPAATSSRSATMPLAIVSFGVGAAGLITGAVTGIVAASKHASLINGGSCSKSGVCSPNESGAVGTFRTIANVSTVAWIVGGAGAAAGLAFVLTAPKSSPVTAYVGPMNVGVVGTF
ncbi:MAG: hypothetical protein ABSF69_26000 [Polyangiaceae bacterium]|jgi:hypothetical protein